MTERVLLQRIDQAGPLTWVLAACAAWAVLLWLGALLGMGKHVDEAKPSTTEAALPQPKPPVPDRIGTLTQYAEAASRPLFTRDRRPRSFMATGPESSDGSAQSQSLDFILTGVLISPTVQLAMLQPSGGGESQRVLVGKAPEGASGWRLIEVQPRRAIFEGAGGQSALDLRTFGDTGVPTPASVAVQPPPAGTVDATLTTSGEVAPVEPQSQEARIEAIRKRIEARRAQLRAGQTGTSAPVPSTQPPKP